MRPSPRRPSRRGVRRSGRATRHGRDSLVEQDPSKRISKGGRHDAFGGICGDARRGRGSYSKIALQAMTPATGTSAGEALATPGVNYTARGDTLWRIDCVRSYTSCSVLAPSELPQLIGSAAGLQGARTFPVEVGIVALYARQPLFDDIHDQDRDLGFDYLGNLGRHVSRADGTLLFAVATFIKIAPHSPIVGRR
jgi:hypothetical protein